MGSKKVISRKNMPTRLPVISTLVYWIALDYFHAPQWVWGAVGAVVLVIWIISIVAIANQDEVDILKNKTHD